MKNVDNQQLPKNLRADMRKRNLDTTKQLTIVKSREELKRYE
jgi:hypothetical protein